MRPHPALTKRLFPRDADHNKEEAHCTPTAEGPAQIKMKPDYKNWVPKSMVWGLWCAAAAALVLFVLFGATEAILHGTARLVCALVFGLGTLALLFFAVWMTALHRAFDYSGELSISKKIVEGTAEYVKLPEGGIGLDVGCGSGALTIACAKRNPRAEMVGCDIWSGAYKSTFTRRRCEENAKAEGAHNIRFEEGNAVSLPFADESFDAVTSNYVYHNIAGHDKQKLLLETLRVLKKRGTFAIHDIMSRQRYGDMDAFVRQLKAEGYAEVRLIDTTDGTFMESGRAKWLGLAGSALLAGRK